jgi:hypothetical protein
MRAERCHIQRTIMISCVLFRIFRIDLFFSPLFLLLSPLSIALCRPFNVVTRQKRQLLFFFKDEIYKNKIDSLVRIRIEGQRLFLLAAAVAAFVNLCSVNKN